MKVPRKQRNNDSSNVDDIQFAADITTSLLEQVRHLQGVLIEKDESLKGMNVEKSRLEFDVESYAQRVKHMSDSEQRYKDENWSLETQLQDAQGSNREATARESKMQQVLSAAASEKNSIQLELDDLRQKHGRVSEDYTSMRKTHESELAGMRKNYNLVDTERTSMQRKIEELTSQNQELAKGLQSRLREEQAGPMIDTESALNEDSFALSEREPSPPPSPTKGGQRNSMLESETLRSSLTHAHKMIQNLKGNLNREKSEKSDLKRMLSEARDELELRRVEPNDKRAKSKIQQEAKKPRVGLGAARSGRTDVTTEDPEQDAEWEDNNDTPSHDKALRHKKRDVAVPPLQRGESSDAYQTANETEDAFETANERDTSDTDAFQTGAESLADESSEELTETEGPTRVGTVRARRPSPLTNAKPGDRKSVQSTASTSDDDAEHDIHTPVQGQNQRFRLRSNRYSRRSQIGSVILDSNPSTAKNSPASFTNAGGDAGQSLAAELENLSGDEDGTPSKSGVETPKSSLSMRRNVGERRSFSSLRKSITSQPESPSLRVPSAIYTGAPPVPRMPTVDSGTMTEAWEPTRNEEKSGDRSSISAGFLAKATAASITSRIFGSSPSTPQNKSQVSEPTSGSNIESNSSLNASADSTPLSTRSATSQVESIDGANVDEDLTEKTVTPKHHVPSQQLSFSQISALDTVPTDPVAKSSQPMTGFMPAQAQEPTSGGILGSVFGWRRSSAGPPSQPLNRGLEPKSDEIADAENTADQPMSKSLSTSPTSLPSATQTEYTKPKPSVPKADQSSQTMLSSEHIEDLLRANTIDASEDHDKAAMAPPLKPLDDIGAMTNPTAFDKGKFPEVRIPEGSRDPFGKSIKRPSSVTSTRNRIPQHPPLPVDHQEAIAAAAQRDPSSSVMGPPLAPASAYPNRSMRSRANSRPQTPSQQSFASPSSRGGTTPRVGRYSTARSQTSRRTSLSSFESEIDERFNIRADGMLPQGFQANTDPRMIQAITQTMIGEMMWKYTRKAGRGNMSNTRHARFFWVHPYTRTLYWSDRDPVSANRAELKSKSVAIEAVRVVTDDNPMPPGLHRKSLIVVTPGRSVKFTAQTSQRHETWFNALSYLLLRSGTDGSNPNNAAGELTDADVQEFNPANYDRRSARSRVSVASFRSQATANRNARTSLSNKAPSNSLASRTQYLSQPGPDGGEGDEKRLSIRKRVSRSLSRARSRPEHLSSAGVSDPVVANTRPQTSRRNSNATKPAHSSVSSRISNYWKLPDTSAGNRSSVRSRSSIAADAVGEPGVLEGGRSVVSINGANDSAEDLRRMIEDREARGNLENVRACCDGKF